METQAPAADLLLWPGLDISKMEKTMGHACELGLSPGTFGGGGSFPSSGFLQANVGASSSVMENSTGIR